MQLQKPYKDQSLNLIYDLLFCDSIELYKSNTTQPNAYPWNDLFSVPANQDALNKILEDDNAESRVKILAANKLVAAGYEIHITELLGVIIEVALDDGLDVLASFSDGTARYINYSEKLIVWESPTEKSDELIDNLFAASENVVRQIGPWDKPRLQFPPKGQVRLTFLVSDGLYFGQGPFDVLYEDPMGGPVIEAATYLMKFMTEAAGK